MFETQTFIAFLSASIVIILAPGPAQALVLARSIGSGRKAGILTAVGLNVGTVFHAVAAGLGLSLLLTTSAVAFSAVKYVGAAYLVYLGLRSIITPKRTNEGELKRKATSQNVFTNAVLAGILNPKVAIFFLAFLPQFVASERGSVALQFLILGLIIAALDVVYESLLALAAGAVRDRLGKNPTIQVWRERIAGLAMIGLGVKLAMTRR